MREASFGLPPDLRAGADLVRERVRGVGVLVHVGVAVGLRRRAPPRFADRAVRALERIREHDGGAERPDDSLSLRRDLVGHAELDGMAADGADERERDAGVAACCVEHDPAAAEPTLLLGRDDHPQGRPILDAAAGVRGLELCPELATESPADAAQRNQGRVADALENRAAHTLAHEARG